MPPEIEGGYKGGEERGMDMAWPSVVEDIKLYDPLI